jgi:hypothetical protein
MRRSMELLTPDSEWRGFQSAYIDRMLGRNKSSAGKRALTGGRPRHAAGGAPANSAARRRESL